ncbi:MAG: glycogen phosphorylase [Miltoncostaeaceae bacterium]|jgi:starch phosphorylase|nr:glycogen phosphorylase [Miltoncostaeaceae bacterium]
MIDRRPRIAVPLPPRLAALGELAANAWTTWNPDARALFARLDRAIWRRVEHSPAGLLAELGAERLERAAADEPLVAELSRVHARFRREMDDPGWFARDASASDMLVAYFSCEYGLDASLPLYSGGLGVLSGDHLKSASELGVPLVAMGLFYREGYFRQGLDAEGWQTESYPANDPERMGLLLERDDDGAPLEVSVDLDGEEVRARIWCLPVGRIPLFLLDSDVPSNSPEARAITGRLYGGDREMRIRQEILLGVGGARALDLLDLEPTVFHINEGHSAFLAVERLRDRVAIGEPLADALDAVRNSTVFTTHTPVPAGNEQFEADLVLRYIRPHALAIGLADRELLGLGRIAADEECFGMTVLALRTARFANGVSELHGEVSREMWRALWPDRPVDAVPIGAVTNGVHGRTWLGPEMARLFATYGIRPAAAHGEDRWERAATISDVELWGAHRAQKESLAAFAAERGTPSRLDPDILTIGFSRRFATYKRADLLLRDPARLAALVGDPDRPVQFVFAGKAHPADEGGKRLIQLVLRASRLMGGRLVFLEDYEMDLARHLVQGVDVWLNTPRRPQEASGTSGMKAAMNGVLNLSILDGWWPEAYDPTCGWAIAAADGSGGDDDEVDGETLYGLLEREVVPRYYARDLDGRPTGWLAMMRRSIIRVGGQFTSHRMVQDYVEKTYLPAHRAGAVARRRSAVTAGRLG